MHKGMYIVATDNCQDLIWKKAIESLTQCSSYWIVDCLDCLYDTTLRSGAFATDELLAALDGNKYIFSARVIGVVAHQKLNVDISTLDDYLNSNSHSVILCSDSVHFEVFSKREKQLADLMARLPKDSIVSATWIDDYSVEGRFEFTV